MWFGDLTKVTEAAGPGIRTRTSRLYVAGAQRREGCCKEAFSGFVFKLEFSFPDCRASVIFKSLSV